jgi:hypothetical protein
MLPKNIESLLHSQDQFHLLLSFRLFPRPWFEQHCDASSELFVADH